MTVTTFEATVAHLDGRREAQAFSVQRVYNLGSATRDPQTAVAHQEEVAKSGIHIAFDVPAPRIYPMAPDILSSGDEIAVQSEKTSGEVEIVLLVADQLYVGVGSDHTDRLLESFSILGSKQACANHLAPELWPFAEIRDHWDDCRLKSWVDGRLYQDVGVAAFLHPDDVLKILAERVGELPRRDFVVFCGTIVSVDKALGFGSRWRYAIEDPTAGRQIAAEYRVVNLLDEIREAFRVPLFNPQRT